ncbi:MAG: hypothetical protein E3J56_13950 [Candidatus Aminicenantes bacterium]|nr:MAG: hypothetical protein E3J56_13950 [Candidatus Aminicenantes bacterium]
MGLTSKYIEDRCRKDYAKNAKRQAGMGMLGTETWEQDCEEWRKDWYRDSKIPYYTESISDAFQVVEKMKEKGYAFELGDNHHKGAWYSCFEILMKDEFWGYADTAPLAISLAAKAAVEGS